VIIMNACIVGAIWIHANHVQNNGTGIKEPGFLSWIWNGFWILAILALGFASWAVGLTRRGSGNSALAYPSLVSGDFMVRTLYVTYVAVVIAASTSATLEAVLCWIGIKKNGVTGVSLLRPCMHESVLIVSRTVPSPLLHDLSCSLHPSCGPVTPSLLRSSYSSTAT
jgi:hypothetical protein